MTSISFIDGNNEFFLQQHLVPYLKDTDVRRDNNSDIIFIEWADLHVNDVLENIVKPHQKVIVRLHSYELFNHDIIEAINWEKVDLLIFISPVVRLLFCEFYPKVREKVRMTLIPNGVDLDKFTFAPRPKKPDIIFMGEIGHKKGIPLLVQAIMKIQSKDCHRYHILSKFFEPRFETYFKNITEQYTSSIIRYPAISHNDIDNWINNTGASWAILTSPFEGQNTGIFECMAKGLRPMVHHHPFADLVYPEETLWKSVDELHDMLEQPIDSEKWRSYVAGKYDIRKTVPRYEEEFEKIMAL